MRYEFIATIVAYLFMTGIRIFVATNGWLGGRIGSRLRLLRTRKGVEEMMCKGCEILNGYTGADHLIGSLERETVERAVVGRRFRASRDALRAAYRAFHRVCDPRVRTARIVLHMRGPRGERIVG